MNARALSRLPYALAILFFAAFVLLPLGAMLVPTFRELDGSFTFRLWGQLLSTSNDFQELWMSVQVGVCSALVALVLGGSHAWLTFRTDLPGARWLGPAGVLPLVVPPILVAMGLADFWPVQGFWACACLLGVCYAPFVAVLAGRGLRAVDGRQYEAAWLARGRGPAERMLLRACLPELLAGTFLAFLFAVSEHGVPEFLTVKGKTWHTYGEGVFRRWSRRASGMKAEDLQSPVIAAVPLVLLIVVALWICLRLRARAGNRAPVPLPVRTFGGFRWPALLVPVLFLGAGIGMPVVVMARWAMGSTQKVVPMSLDVMRQSFHGALTQAGGDLLHTLLVSAAAALLALAVALPLARLSARRSSVVEHVSVLPLAVPAILLAIGFVHAFNAPVLAGLYAATFDFYDSGALLVTAYAARFLPFGVLTLSSAIRRIPPQLEEAARLSGRSPVARALRIHLPLALPAAASAGCLLFVLCLRELDTAVVLPAGNDTIVRRLSNVVHFGGENTGGALALMLLGCAILVPFLVVLASGRRLQSLS